jgi:ADP-ribose pyrophosphatase YjhB (NUDIX family)
MNFCSHCGAGVSLRIPAGDSLPRHVCGDCGSIHYSNPKLVVGTITEYGDRILLCRRAIEPRHGFWTLPAGFMENGESTAEGAVRETLEEACARIEIGDLFTLISIPHIDQVHLMYRARLPEPEFAAGEESLEVALFGEHEFPWSALAFRTLEVTLRH